MMMNPLLDKDFLKALDEHREKETYAKIIALTYQEDPIEEITGRVTGGSVSINGSSAIRRTCSLSMIAQDLDINDYYWGEKNKFKLFLGVKNKIDSRYPDMIWFPQGTYVISSFNSSLSLGSFNISIQGRDKMCLLNGEIGGMVHSLTADFGSYDQIDQEGNVINIKMVIRDIIKSMVHEYGKEPYHNIVINDLEDTGVELMEYRGDNPLYFLVDYFKDEVTNIILKSDQQYQIVEEVSANGIVTKTTEGALIGLDEIPSYDMRAQLDMSGTSRPPVTLIAAPDFEDGDVRKIPYSVMAIQYGETVGYRITDLTYAGDLISNVGESITSVLDKIINMLGDFEYFYDIDGRFIFQKKPTFIYTSWNNITRIEDEEFVNNAAFSSACVYHFEDNNLISSFSNSPDLGNVRNDFSIWGTRKGVSGKEIPVHLRYAIDKKPDYYKNFKGQTFVSNERLYNELLEKITTKIEEEIRQEVDNFEFNYLQEYPIPLQQPEKMSDGSWGAGWWDIRDWFEYYKMLTGEEPRGTMKWYSSNDLNGCVPLQTLPGRENDTSDNYVWLIIVDPETKKINIQHGSGNPERPLSLCTYYESHLDENGRVVTVKAQPLIQKKFMHPYAGCSDPHTYLEFLKSDVEKGNLVYFYHPHFPDKTFDQTMKDKIEVTIKEYLDKDYLKLVDWREIIYQMSLDYYRYAHNTDLTKGLIEDAFLATIRDNNIDYYPKGYTGYEQYYQDLQGFWRQLYNPWPEYETEFQSAAGLATNNTPPDKVLIENAFRPFEKYMIDSTHTDLEISEELYYRLLSYDKTYESAGLILKEETTTGIIYKIKDEDILEALIKEKIPGKDHDTSSYAYYVYQNDSNGKNMALWYDTLKIKTAYNEAKNLNIEHFEKALYYFDDSQTQYKDDLATCYDYPYFKIIDDRTLENPIVESHYTWEISHLPAYIEKCDLYYKKLELTTDAQTEININQTAWNKALADVEAAEYSDPALKEDAKKRCNATYQKAKKDIEDKYTQWIPWFEHQTPPSEIFIKDNDNTLVEYNDLPEKIQKLYYDNNQYAANILVRNYDRWGEIAKNTKTEIQYVQAVDPDTNEPLVNADGEPIMTPKVKPRKDPDGKEIPGEYELDFKITETISYDEYPTTFYQYYYSFNTDGNFDNLYWNKEVTLYPETLNFWFDFLDINNGELAQFAVNVIGDRPKAVNDSSVKAIYFRETPRIILVNSEEWDTPRDEKPGYTYINLPPELEGMFTISAQGKSAKVVLDQFLFDYAYCAETISITSIPIYYLEPNTRIFVRDDNSKINGEYIISSINLPLTYNGTMSISAAKATQNIY